MNWECQDGILETSSHVCLHKHHRWLLLTFDGQKGLSCLIENQPLPLVTLFWGAKWDLKTMGKGQIWKWNWAITRSWQCNRIDLHWSSFYLSICQVSWVASHAPVQWWKKGKRESRRAYFKTKTFSCLQLKQKKISTGFLNMKIVLFCSILIESITTGALTLLSIQHPWNEHKEEPQSCF